MFQLESLEDSDIETNFNELQILNDIFDGFYDFKENDSSLNQESINSDSVLIDIINEECCICLIELKSNSSIISCDICKQTYHLDCIKVWFKFNHKCCPICRNRRNLYEKVYYNTCRKNNNLISQTNNNILQPSLNRNSQNNYSMHIWVRRGCLKSIIIWISILDFFINLLFLNTINLLFFNIAKFFLFTVFIAFGGNILITLCLVFKLFELLIYNAFLIVCNLPLKCITCYCSNYSNIYFIIYKIFIFITESLGTMFLRELYY
mgnify:CR=1 FL=1|tara:strand:+ start:3035 stop:3826 length:792 start_codon:yes stop_codon:yes gene_type:complete